MKTFKCQECGETEKSYAHLFVGQRFGPWYCDNCGLGVYGVVLEDGVELKKVKDRKVNTLVLLKLNVPNTDIHIVVRGMDFSEDGTVDYSDDSSTEYYYNEHTCPWNYLRLPIKDGDDTDPHGLFVFQEKVLMPKGYDDHLRDIEDWKELFSSLREEEV